MSDIAATRRRKQISAGAAPYSSVALAQQPLMVRLQIAQRLAGRNVRTEMDIAFILGCAG
jgi:hypothetical protein